MPENPATARTLLSNLRPGSPLRAKCQKPIVIIIALLVLSSRTFAETPKEFAARFLNSDCAYSSVRGSWENDPRQRFFGIEMIRTYRAASRALERWEARHRKSTEILMIPHIYPGSFSGVDISPATFEIGKIVQRSGKTAVLLHFHAVERGEHYRWIDTLVLDRAGSEWVVFDYISDARGSTMQWIREFQQRVDRYK